MKIMNTTIEKNIGEIVAENYRTAQIFKNHRIDFCCKGNRSLKEVAEKNNLDVNLLIEELEMAQLQTNNENIDFTSWALDLLADYIEKKHHRYVESQIPVLNQYLKKLCQVHGERHPELHEIYQHFKKSGGELAMHMKKEELVLFPYIRKMVKAKLNNATPEKAVFGSVQNPIQLMREEHENEGDRFRSISDLSNDYTPPADACNTYRVTFSLLKEFEEDLHRHIHLENNILFPRAEELEKQLADTL